MAASPSPCFPASRKRPNTPRRAGHLGAAVVLAFSVGLFSGPGVSATRSESPQETPASAVAHLEKSRSLTLKQVGAGAPLRLDGTPEGEVLWFGIRDDEVVNRARLRVRFTASPALISELSHIKVLMNEEVIAVIPLPKEKLGTEQVQDIGFNPAFLSSSNSLRFQLVGHYTRECEDPLHSSIWVSISNQSELELSTQSVDLPNDLAILPSPFLDLHTSERLTLPIYLAGTDASMIHASGVLASWLGVKAGYRRARFPVLLKEIPQRHGVMLLTNDKIPPGLGLKPVDKPTIQITRHPDKPGVKLLVLLGKDSVAVDQAAMALALGQAALTGPVATVSRLDLPAPRQPYDAPNWASSDRPTRIGDLVTDPSQLQLKGRNPPPTRLHLRVAPDLLIWDRDRVNMDLHIRYTPPAFSGNALFSTFVNDTLAGSTQLQNQSGLEQREMDLKLIGSNPDVKSTLKIPAFQLGSDNELAFSFLFGDFRQGYCSSSAIGGNIGTIDADSTIDFSGFYHYAVLPDLGSFISSGFPFTRLADLSETALVLPQSPAATDIEAAMSLLAQMSFSSGVPALRHQVVLGDQREGLRDKDLLVIGTAGAHPLLTQWKAEQPASLNTEGREFGHDFSLTEAFAFKDLASMTRRVGQLGRAGFTATGSLAALTGFESPLTSGRSVVSFEATDTQGVTDGLDTLESAGIHKFVNGDVAILRNHAIESYQIGDHYYRGDVPAWVWLGFRLSQHPLLSGALALVAGALLAVMMFRALRSRQQKRLEDA